MLGTTYPSTEIFVFGGEPFLHPNIEYIIQCFNEFEIPYVIQTNFSKKSVKVMKTIKERFNINISVHPTEIKLNTLMNLFNQELPHVDIKVIDVMYVGQESVKYYLKIKGNFKKYAALYLTPVTEFGEGSSNRKLHEYNELRTNKLLSQIVRFEEVKEFGEYRSILWANNGFSPKGKPCLYNNRYFLYGPDLTLYNCCYRELHTGICNHFKCFLM
jgi:organic radical activating enzyme